MVKKCFYYVQGVVIATGNNMTKKEIKQIEHITKTLDSIIKHLEQESILFSKIGIYEMQELLRQLYWELKKIGK